MQGFHLCGHRKAIRRCDSPPARHRTPDRGAAGRSPGGRESVHPYLRGPDSQLEISGRREDDGKRLPRHHRGRGNASRTIEDGRVTRKARAPHIEIRAHLGGPEKSHGVRLVRLECPSDSVSGVNPDFIGQKSQSLNSFVVGLGADSRGPLRLHHLWKDQKGEEQGPAEDGYKASPPGFVYDCGRCNVFRFGFVICLLLR